MTKDEIEQAAIEFFTNKAQFGKPSPAFIRDVVEFVETILPDPFAATNGPQVERAEEVGK